MQPNAMGVARFACIVALVSSSLFGQGTPAGQSSPDALAGFSVAQNIKNDGYPSLLTDVAIFFRGPFVDYVRAKSTFSSTFGSFLQSVENGRVDEQAGASATAGGTASAAEKAGITGLLTAALEGGALTQTLDQNLLTVRGNGEGLLRFLSGQEVLPVCLYPTDTSCDPSPLNNLELTASFDVSNSNTQAVTGQNPLDGSTLAALLTSNKHQFSSAGVRFAILNSRDLRSPKYRTAWNAWYVQNRASLAGVSATLLASEDFYRKMQTMDVNGKPVPDGSKDNDLYALWKQGAVIALTAAPRTPEGISAALAQQLDLLVAALRKAFPDFDAQVLGAANAYSRYYANTKAGFDLGNQPLLTLEVTYQEPTLQPKMVNAKFVFAWSPKQKGTMNPGTVTINGGVSTYTKAQPSDVKGNTNFWKDAQFALQFDRPIDKRALSALSFGAYIQYQMSPGLIDIPSGSVAPGTSIPLPGNATQLLAPKGTIAVAQASITLQLPNSGVKVPIGISWSNRTELLTGSEIRGHVGFSFDTHSLLLLGK